MSDDVQDSVRQWIAKAEIDWATVGILRRDAAAPREAICFHCQQYVEKLLKAVLTLRAVEAPRTHDLGRLVQLAAPFVPGLGDLADGADRLSLHGVRSRYPNDWRDIGEFELKEMLDLAERFSAIILPVVSGGR
jgi:HEPN domain-containing protein